MTGAVPELLVLTDRRRAAAAGRSLAATVAAALDGGPCAVVVREKDLPRPDRARLAAELLALARPRGGRVVVASDAALAHHLGADGVHLAAADPWPALPLALVGRSCHHRGDLARAAAEGAAYATLSPVLPTTSKPGYGPPLGPAALAGSPLPTLALGGVGPASAGACVAAGGAGVAVMGAVMGADDPAAVVAAVLAAVAEARVGAGPGASADAIGARSA